MPGSVRELFAPIHVRLQSLRPVWKLMLETADRQDAIDN